jgi:hypothetical protein
MAQPPKGLKTRRVWSDGAVRIEVQPSSIRNSFQQFLASGHVRTGSIATKIGGLAHVCFASRQRQLSGHRGCPVRPEFGGAIIINKAIAVKIRGIINPSETLKILPSLDRSTTWRSATPVEIPDRFLVAQDGTAYRWRRSCLLKKRLNSVAGRFMTTRGRDIIPRPFVEPARFQVWLQECNRELLHVAMQNTTRVGSSIF